MLSPIADQGTPIPTRVEERGKHKATPKESSTSKRLSLLKEIKEEMGERDEQMREELRLRDNHHEDKIKKRDNTLATAL